MPQINFLIAIYSIYLWEVYINYLKFANCFSLQYYYYFISHIIIIGFKVIVGIIVLGVGRLRGRRGEGVDFFGLVELENSFMVGLIIIVRIINIVEDPFKVRLLESLILLIYFDQTILIALMSICINPIKFFIKYINIINLFYWLVYQMITILSGRSACLGYDYLSAYYC